MSADNATTQVVAMLIMPLANALHRIHSANIGPL